MDINLKIIEQVKKCPQLYQRNCNLLERKRLWNMLSNTMKLDEQFLKSRWYILRERYTKMLRNAEQQEPRKYFKYAKEMDFIKEHVVLRATSNSRAKEEIQHSWIKPEFIITEADLQWKPEREPNAEEMFFINSEGMLPQHSQELQSHSQELQQQSQKLQQHSQEVEEVEQAVVIDEEIPYDQAKEQEKEHEREQITTLTQQCELQSATQEFNTQTTLTENVAAVLQLEPERKVIVEQITIKQETVPEVDDAKTTLAKTHSTDNNEKSCKNLEENSKNEVATMVSREEGKNCVQVQNANGRCEDSIFGELVTAMLKTMEPTKKKTVKKDIMNLLLS